MFEKIFPYPKSLCLGLVAPLPFLSYLLGLGKSICIRWFGDVSEWGIGEVWVLG